MITVIGLFNWPTSLLTWDVLVLNGYLVLNLMVPACILLFLGIWIERGIGLIVPGLVPSPMCEIVDYAPSWVEVSVTLGILALGVFIVSLLLKPALIIEQRYEAQKG